MLPPSNKKVLYFNGLNGIRALASILVLLSHVTRVKFHSDNSTLEYLFADMGGVAVTMFFTLSGFLITYLLVAEKSEGDISIRNFYIRRSLRIWPLYYLYIAIILALIAVNVYKPDFDKKTIFYYLFFATNLISSPKTIYLLTHYWTLASEEQFYLFWPFLIKKTKYKNVILALALFITIWLVGKAIAYIIQSQLGISSPLNFFMKARFDCMAIGGLAACLMFFQKSRILQFLVSKTVESTGWIILLIYLFSQFSVLILIDPDIIAVATSLIILSQVNNQTFLSLEKKWLNYLGKLSYGIYIIHPLIIWLLHPVFDQIHCGKWLFYSLYVTSTLVISTLIAHFVYYHFELRFLKLKSKFATVKTTAVQ